jgi:C_GCAxxG_C_C family probable redox protein
MGRGGICGVLISAFMVLGFKFQGEADERQARYKTYDFVKEFIGSFETNHGTIVCKELLGGVDLGTEAGRRQALERELFTTVCPKFVQSAADILEKML